MDGRRAEPAINSSFVEMPSPSSRFFIPSVQSGAFIAQQYLALLDEYNQVCANNRGAMLKISISDN